VKVTDFGIAVMAGSNLAEAIELGIEKSLSASTTLVGAIPYMAPELIRAPKSADREADIWALGSILYELISGERPFGGQLLAVAKILNHDLPTKPISFGNIAQFGKALDQLWSIVMACLVQNPVDRPPAAQLAVMCEDLCYSSFERHVGVIGRYPVDGKSIGFIQHDDGGDVFFHRDSYYGPTPVVGQRVVFSSFDGSAGMAPRAHPVVPLL
jgi:serine/threonine protein kinase